MSSQSGLSPNNQLLLFAKAPRLGTVKSRLAQTLGPEGALKVYRELLSIIATNLSSLETVTVYFSPPDAADELCTVFPPHWDFRAQRGDDLGERLTNAFSDAFASGAERVAAIGSDCPYLENLDIIECWKKLAQSDVVFGPATDGGYWLIAMNALEADLFRGVPWSTDSVLSESIVRARSKDLRHALLRTLSDIDTEQDWLEYLAWKDSLRQRD